VELRDYLRILRKRWREVLLIFLVVISTYSAYLRVGRKLPYRSTILARVAKSPAEFGYLYAENIPSVPVYSFDQKVRLFTSLAVCRKASEALKVEGLTLDAQAIRASVTTSAVGDDQAVLLAAVSEDPDLARRMVGAVLKAMIAYDEELARSYYQEQLAVLKGAIDRRKREREGLVTGFQTLTSRLEASGLYLPEEQVGARISSIGSLETTRIRLLLDLRRLETQKKAGGQGLPLPPRFPEGVAVPGIDASESQFLGSLKGRLVDLDTQLARLKNRYTDVHPRVLELDSERKAIVKAIEEAATRPRTADDEGRIDAEISVAKDQISFLDEAIKERGEALVKLSRERTEYRDLQQQQERATGAIEDFGKRISEVEVQMSGVKSSISSDEQPSVGVPFGSRGLESLPFAAVLALVLGIAGGYAIEYLNNTIRTSQDVKVYLSLPAISSMPLFDEEHPSLLDASPQSPVWELFNRLSTLLEAVAIEQRARTFLFTSVRPEEGKSTLAANVSIALAQGGERVILVDSDLRNPTIHSFFGLENVRGLADVLSEATGGEAATLDSFLQATPIPSLRVLTSGPIPSNPVSLLKSPRMGWLLSELKKTGCIAIFDSPPVLELTDAAILGTHLDATIFILAEGYVTRREAIQAKHVLTQVGANIAGVILNKGVHQPTEYYYYRYSRYGRYGRKV